VLCFILYIDLFCVFYYYEIVVIVLYKLEIAHAASFCLRSDGLGWAGFISSRFCFCSRNCLNFVAKFSV